MTFKRPLGIAMLLTGAGCLIGAIVLGNGSAWSAAAMCFCTSCICLVDRRKPSGEG